MATSSLRKDHDLIEKVIKAMDATIQLLKNGKTIPKEFLFPVIDFSKNFTIVCHHGKEENTLFPALEKSGMLQNMGPIAKMLMEHKITKEIANRMEKSSNNYLSTGDCSQLILDMEEYVKHVSQHLWKENNRLFMMAEMRLQRSSADVEKSLDQTEQSKFSEIGKDRTFYENLADELSKKIN